MHRRTGLFAVVVLLLLAGALAVSCARPPVEKAESAPPARPAIVFMTDFGTANDAVAICKAVMLGILPEARIMDITHQVTPFSIEEGARLLHDVSPYYPVGTVFLGVVDPGVGTSRKAMAVKTRKGQYFIVPDNGLVWPVVERDGLDTAREIASQKWMIQAAVSSTFHGRDIFSPAAAHLAAGWDFDTIGPVVTDLVRLTPQVSLSNARGISGDVIALDDPFGSLITDIPGEEFQKLGYELGDQVTVRLNEKPMTLPYLKTFMEAAIGAPLLYIDSRGRVGLAINERNFSQAYKITPPATIFIPRKGARAVSKKAPGKAAVFPEN